MASIGVVTGRKYVNGNTVDFMAPASIQADGYVYFNDDSFYRCRQDGSGLEVHYADSPRWVKTSIISSISYLTFNVSSVIGGGGATAPDANVESAVQWALAIAADDSHGYDQAHRMGPDYDCSSLIGHAFQGFGVNPGCTTYTMRADFTAHGFVWHPGNPSASDLIRGDIVLCESAHTELYTGNGKLVGAHINEFGGTRGGQTGDQTGGEISEGGYYSFPWDGFLRYGG